MKYAKKYIKYKVFNIIFLVIFLLKNCVFGHKIAIFIHF